MDQRLDPLMRASRVVTAVIVRSLSSTAPDLSVTQLRVLSLVGTQAEPMTVGDVAAALAVNPSNASRTCDRLDALGLLRRQPSATDRRQVELRLTDEGAALLDSVLEQRRALLAEVVDQMDPAVQDQLLEALEEFAAAAGRLALIRPAESGDDHLMAWLR